MTQKEWLSIPLDNSIEPIDTSALDGGNGNKNEDRAMKYLATTLAIVFMFGNFASTAVQAGEDEEVVPYCHQNPDFWKCAEDPDWHPEFGPNFGEAQVDELGRIADGDDGADGGNNGESFDGDRAAASTKAEPGESSGSQ